MQHPVPDFQQISPVPRELSYSKLSSSYSYQASLATIPSHTCIHPTPVAIHDTNHLPIYSPYVCSVFQGMQLPALLFHTYGRALSPTLTLHSQVELIEGGHLACKYINLQCASMNLRKYPMWSHTKLGSSVNNRKQMVILHS